MLEESFYHLNYLRQELSKRCKKNQGYSLRAFARDLKIDPASLSSVLNEKRALSFRLASKIVENIGLGEKHKNRILASVASHHQQRNLRRRNPKVKQFLDYHPFYRNPKSLNPEIYKVISDWHYAAILELTYVDGFRGNAQWIAKQLDISSAEAKAALKSLLDMGLIKDVEGKFVKTHDHLELKDSTGTSQARRKKQIQIRKKAIESIEKDPVNERYMTSITMCIDPEKLPEARRRIDEFNDSLCAFLESGKRSQVYSMEIGLFSLQKNKEKEGDVK